MNYFMLNIKRFRYRIACSGKLGASIGVMSNIDVCEINMRDHGSGNGSLCNVVSGFGIWTLSGHGIDIAYDQEAVKASNVVLRMKYIEFERHTVSYRGIELGRLSALRTEIYDGGKWPF